MPGNFLRIALMAGSRDFSLRNPGLDFGSEQAWNEKHYRIETAQCNYKIDAIKIVLQQYCLIMQRIRPAKCK